MTSKRHAKPTAAQLLARIYRQNIEFKRMLLNQMAHIRLDIVTARREDREHMKTLTDHCARLLREKETLMRLKDVSAYKAAPLRCEFAANHRINHRCHACGHLEISEDNFTQQEYPHGHGMRAPNLSIHCHPFSVPCTPECPAFPKLRRYVLRSWETEK